jgi:hypothetical protein
VISTRIVAALVFFLAGACVLAAQDSRGAILGVVMDGAGRPVASSVVVASEETGKRRTYKVGGSGRFAAHQLDPGRWRVTVKAAGYQEQTRVLELTVNHEVDLRIALVREGQREAVTVEGAAPLVRTDTTATGGSVLNSQIVDLPLDGRNYYELVLLLPGVAPPAEGSAGSVRGKFAVNVNGMREDANGFLLDGVYNGDPTLNGPAVTSPVDAIREFEVAASTYDASFGRNAGAQVNVVLKSGTNAVHGTVYQFFRNAALDARNFFSPAGEPDPRYQRNQFGFSLGGPIRRNRTFFFTDYEGRRMREGFPRITNVPTGLERQGDFSQSPVPVVIDPAARAPFPGARIPLARIDPIGSRIAALYPLPNRPAPGRNFVSAPIARDTNDSFDVRIDHSLGARSQLAARYSFGDRFFFEPFAGPAFAQVPGFGNLVPRRGQNAMISETRTFTPNFINELRLGFNRVAVGVTQENYARNLNAEVGLPTDWGDPRRQGLSMITVLGHSPLGDEFNNPQANANNTYQVSNLATWSRGRTTVKFGGEYRKLEQSAFRDVQARGFINFIGFTGNALSELLQGLPAVSGRARVDNPQRLRMESYNAFAQASHRVSQALTLHLGLRYEYNTPAVDPGDRATLYDEGTRSLVAAGTGGMPRAGYYPDRNNFGPRAGFAWAPGRGLTVVRGGYGVYFDQSSLAPSEGLYFNAPHFDFRLFFALPNLPLTLRNPFPSNFPVAVPGSAFAFDRGLRTPYIQHWNFQIQRQIGTRSQIEVGYVGSKGTRLLAARDINQGLPTPGPMVMRPNRMFDDISRLESRANSNFHSFQLGARRQLANGFTFMAGYTFARSIDDASGFFPSASDPNFPQDSNNLRAERARSNFDIRQRFVLSYSYLLPRVRGPAGWLLNGWQTHGIWVFQTGRPFTVALPSDLDNSGTGRSMLGFGANDRPHVLRNPALDRPGADRWFDTAAFVIPARGTFGNAGRNIVDGPGFATFNLSLFRNFSVRESWTLQFRVESFNALNRANFNQPESFLGGAGFGSITSAQHPRHIQLGLKLLF